MRVSLPLLRICSTILSRLARSLVFCLASRVVEVVAHFDGQGVEVQLVEQFA